MQFLHICIHQKWTEVIIDTEIVFGKTYKRYRDTKQMIDGAIAMEEHNLNLVKSKPSRGKEIE